MSALLLLYYYILRSNGSDIALMHHGSVYSIDCRRARGYGVLSSEA